MTSHANTGNATIDDLITSAAAGDSNAAATVALVHATLALVEQQRIANLIALRNVMASRNKVNTRELHPQDQADLQALIPIVRDGLGL